MEKSHHTRDIVFPSLEEAIVLIEALVAQIKMDFYLSEDLSNNIMVALSEAVNNAFYHGNQKSMGKKVRLKVEKENQKITFYIEDEGVGFNISELRDPTTPENIDKPSGRGIFLMRHLADHVEFTDEGRK